jgi:hypothetical protein
MRHADFVLCGDGSSTTEPAIKAANGVNEKIFAIGKESVLNSLLKRIWFIVMGILIW